MSWDFAEVNPFSTQSGSFGNCLDYTAKGIQSAGKAIGVVQQADATTQILGQECIVSTDPPYYDNIGYADLSDFFYVWLRRSLGRVYPQLFSTMLVPKAQELVATPYRFEGSRERAQRFFETGLGRAFANMRAAQHPHLPLTLFYAFKQAESESAADDDGSRMDTAIASTGWETMLAGLIAADFCITGTWPMRSELSNRMVASGTNALASSIVLVCRPRAADAPRTTRRAFLDTLKKELPGALRDLQRGNVAPVDLAQASIGPGMAVFSRYAAVLDAEGKPVTVRQALQFINQALDEVMVEQEGEFDEATRWAIAWFAQYQMNAGPYGVAETLSKAKNTSVEVLRDAGFVESRAGKVRLLRRDELPKEWAPEEGRLPVWEAAQYLVRALENDGETGAAALLPHLRGTGEVARDLAYRLYTVCEQKGWAQEALSYNSLAIAWPEIVRLAARQAVGESAPRQQALFT
jgi:putative DNA methylase